MRALFLVPSFGIGCLVVGCGSTIEHSGSTTTGGAGGTGATTAGTAGGGTGGAGGSTTTGGAGGSTTSGGPPGTFDCGGSFCDQATQLCFASIPVEDGPTTFECLPLPACDGGDPCSCFSPDPNAFCTTSSSCATDPDGGTTYTCCWV